MRLKSVTVAGGKDKLKNKQYRWVSIYQEKVGYQIRCRVVHCPKSGSAHGYIIDRVVRQAKSIDFFVIIIFISFDVGIDVKEACLVLAILTKNHHTS